MPYALSFTGGALVLLLWTVLFQGAPNETWRAVDFWKAGLWAGSANGLAIVSLIICVGHLLGAAL